MEDDSSNDVIAMDSVMPLADGPIIQFFKRLIVNSSSQNTMLTNAQIQEILTKEFNIDLLKLHELEIEIYINVLKKYLKDWPIWDDFDHTAKELTSRGDKESLSKLLENHYENLKGFLQINLDIAKPLAAECAAKIRNKPDNTLKKALGPPDSIMVLEIQATREQLNTLVLRQPDTEKQNTIFKHFDNSIPKHITVNTLSLDAILNWWSVAISINLQWIPSGNNLFLKRETIHKLDHVLVNRKNENSSITINRLNVPTQIKTKKKVCIVSRKQLHGCLDLLQSVAAHNSSSNEIKLILECFKKDLTFLPFCVAPAHYRRYYSDYPYIRYLYAPTDGTHSSKYDIQLKETVSPMLQISTGQIDKDIDTVLPPNWLKVDCQSCKRTFYGEHLVTELRQHFDEYHPMEPDWQCANCQKSFSMSYLASKYWTHDCGST
ncbi:uncharacterized protein [Epargyreus clarus]|uniref:uncharacterized protein n=1 Tax=Epargyreus clarus TaxID=520877 RepID=UPI003C2E5413